jgi:hypothetical protein
VVSLPLSLSTVHTQGDSFWSVDHSSRHFRQKDNPSHGRVWVHFVGSINKARASSWEDTGSNPTTKENCSELSTLPRPPTTGYIFSTVLQSHLEQGYRAGNKAVWITSTLVTLSQWSHQNTWHWSFTSRTQVLIWKRTSETHRRKRSWGNSLEKMGHKSEGGVTQVLFRQQEIIRYCQRVIVQELEKWEAQSRRIWGRDQNLLRLKQMLGRPHLNQWSVEMYACALS